MKIGDIVYYVETHDANLPHQEDGVDLFEGEIIKDEEGHKKELYFLIKQLLYTVGKLSYSNHGKKKKRPSFSSIGVRFKVPFQGRKVFNNLNAARREMIEQIFSKERWL